MYSQGPLAADWAGDGYLIISVPGERVAIAEVDRMHIAKKFSRKIFSEILSCAQFRSKRPLNFRKVQSQELSSMGRIRRPRYWIPPPHFLLLGKPCQNAFQ